MALYPQKGTLEVRLQKKPHYAVTVLDATYIDSGIYPRSAYHTYPESVSYITVILLIAVCNYDHTPRTLGPHRRNSIQMKPIYDSERAPKVPRPDCTDHK